MKVLLPRLVIGAVILVGSFFLTLSALDYFVPRCPAGAATFPMRGRFAKVSEQGVAYVTNVPEWSDIETPGDTSSSNTAVCENNVSLGPAHSYQGDILTKGRGRFVHSKVVLIFSTSDNSDPNTNGRRYSIVRLRGENSIRPPERVDGADR